MSRISGSLATSRQPWNLVARNNRRAAPTEKEQRIRKEKTMENRITLTSCILPAGGRAPVVAALALLTATLAPAPAYESQAGNTEDSVIKPPITRAASSTSGSAKGKLLPVILA